MNRVLDASAMIASLRGEQGGEVMKRIFKDPQSTCYAHPINMSEVYRSFCLAGDVEDADRFIQMLKILGVQIREDMDEGFWKDAVHWRLNFPMSHADSIGIALAHRLSADFVTCDHHEFEPVNDSGAHVITFIR